MNEIRTFACRKQNRMTPAQKKALDSEVLTKRISSIESMLKIEKPLILDIGFGMGDSLIALSKSYPEHQILGIDIYRPGIASALILCEQSKCSNVFILEHDAVAVIEKLNDSSISGIQLLFPDPWPKKRHAKRRFVQLERMKKIHKKLVVDGWFRLITDDYEYALHAEESIDLGLFQKDADLIDIITKYHRRAENLGHDINKFFFRKT